MIKEIKKESDAPFSLLYKHGFFLTSLELEHGLQKMVLEEDWTSLDSEIDLMCQKGSLIYEALEEVTHFESIEHLLSLRQAPDEDGIWHDDGSRVLAFSLSLNLEPSQIRGGALSIRKKVHKAQYEVPIYNIGTLPFGTLTIFLTGHDHFEHMTNAVLEGSRLVAAGWCSL